MRIGFVEARDRTNFFKAIGDELVAHDVFWLVENHAYALPGLQNVTKLAYPRKRGGTGQTPLTAADNEILATVARSDRSVVYFEQTTQHYEWYYRQIVQWFDRVQPHVVFGEASSFQAHMTALIAQQRSIPFLNPMSSRYPTGRFAFYQYDRMTPLGGDPAQPAASELAETLADIVAGRSRPDYMTVKHSPVSKLLTRARMAMEWARGERYNLQSPTFFMRRGAARKKARQDWELLASSERGGAPGDSPKKPRILYPLQMQPEVNLDVWGRDLRDQPALIHSLSALADRIGGELWVKPNPKSFHELSPELVATVKSLPQVRIVSHSTKMDDIVDSIDLVVTVSGTVGIERALKGHPALILLDDYADWIGYPQAGTIANSIDDYGVAEFEAAIELVDNVRPIDVLGNLVKTSYRGVISEPSLTPGVLEPENVSRVTDAFTHVLSLVAGNTGK